MKQLSIEEVKKLENGHFVWMCFPEDYIQFPALYTKEENGIRFGRYIKPDEEKNNLHTWEDLERAKEKGADFCLVDDKSFYNGEDKEDFDND